MKMIFQEIFPQENPVTYQSKMDTAGPLIKFTFSEFDSYISVLFFINLLYLT